MPANVAATPKRTRDGIVLVWHRKAGNDLTRLALTIREMKARLGQIKGEILTGSRYPILPSLQRRDA